MKNLESFVLESSKISVAEMLEDIKNVNNAYELKEKKAIADKYGIQSKKIKEIEHAILIKAAEDRATRKTYDENDIKAFRQLTNMPEIYNKFEAWLKLEPEEFIKYLKDYYEEYLKKEKIFNYVNWRPSDLKYHISYNKIYSIKIYQFLIKYLEENGSDNADARSAKEKAIELILSKLDAQLEDFKQQLLNQIEEQSKTHWQSLKDNLEKYKSIYKKAKKEFNDYQSDRSNRFSLPDVMKKYSELEEKYKDAYKIYSNADYITSNWTKESYGKYCRKEGLREYERKKHVMAEKIVDRNFDYANITFSNVKRDPKGIEMMISDGVKKVYARSIIAAEYSDKVICHFRFILTDRK